MKCCTLLILESNHISCVCGVCVHQLAKLWPDAHQLAKLWPDDRHRQGPASLTSLGTLMSRIPGIFCISTALTQVGILCVLGFLEHKLLLLLILACLP